MSRWNTALHPMFLWACWVLNTSSERGEEMEEIKVSWGGRKEMLANKRYIGRACVVEIATH